MVTRFRVFRVGLCGLLFILALSVETFTVRPIDAQSNQPTLTGWHFYGDYATAEDDPCQQNLPPGGFTLGLDKTACSGGENGGTAAATLDIPPSENNHLVLIRIVCAGGAGCAKALTASGAGEVSLSIDGQTFWSAPCDVNGMCDTLALGDTPEIAFVTTPPAQHRLTLTTSPHLAWPIARIELQWQTTPDKIQGIAYSPYRDCQNPHFGPFPTIQQIHEDMVTLRNMGNTIRTYSSAGIEGEIPAIAKQYGLRVSAGAWLGKDRLKNEEEIAALIKISQEVELESVIVGNEVLLRHDLTEAELIAYIQRVKAAVDVPVTTADVAFVFREHPDLVKEIDYVLVHIYGYWEKQPIDNAARYVVNEYHSIQDLVGEKSVVIGETGWPSYGPAYELAIPSAENQRRFMREFLTLASQEDVEFYYFSAFNELWKTEGGVGSFWGLLDSERHTQYDFQSVLVPMNAEIQTVSVAPGPVATSTPAPQPGSSGPYFPVYTNYAVFSEDPEQPTQSNHFGPSGFMGDIHTLKVDTCAYADESWQNRAVSLEYTPSTRDLGKWAGVYWQNPDGNWGTEPDAGYDLTGYAQLHFIARAATDGAQVQFFVGGINNGPYPSSIPAPIYAQEADPNGFVTLYTTWHDYHIDLRGANLSYVIDGFGWVADQFHTPDGVTVFVDNILYETTPPPVIEATPVPPPSQLVIVNGSQLARGFSLGIDTSNQERYWVSDQEGFYRLDYPAGQAWGAVFFTVGNIAPAGQRETLDLSEYAAVAVDLRGEIGGEIVSIGVKDSADLDDAAETKIPKLLTASWQTYVFPLSAFATADPTQIYIPLEIVFEPGTPAQTIYVRNVRYLRSAIGS